MGNMVDGVWRADEEITAVERGAFKRRDSAFRTHVTPQTAAAGRYHLYISLACPWAHRTLIFRALKGLEAMIGVSVTNYLMRDQGWDFAPADGVVADPLFGARAIHELYSRADPAYTGRCSVPVLWDRETGTIVNNESSEIIRMFNSAFDGVGATPGDFYPAELRVQIDAVNARIYDTVNNGVYKAGFATEQAPYEAAVAALFETLDWAEARLARQPYLCGERITEADWRFFTTLIRFDPVYHGHFKCNVRRLVDYPALWAYTTRLYHVPKVAETVNLTHIKRHYYMSHPWINPTRIVPLGPGTVIA